MMVWNNFYLMGVSSMKEKITGGIGGVLAVLFFIISYVAFITPAIVVLLHFGIRGIFATILLIIYVYFVSYIPVVNEVLLILGAIFAYTDFPLSFFIVYCCIFGLFTLITIINLISAFKK